VDSQRVALGRILLVDGGDFFNRIAADRWRESVTTWQEMQRLGYDAVTLGELELRQWSLTDSLLQQATTLPLVTTNIERRVGDDWTPLGARCRLVDVDGVRVGFISVLPEGRTSAYALEQTKGVLRLLPALETTREVARLLKGGSLDGSGRSIGKDEARRLAREKADILVLIGYLDKQGMETYADSIPEVDIILGGVHQATDNQPVRLGHAIVNRSGDRGVAVALTDVVVSPQNEIVEFSGRTAVLGESYPEDAQVAAAAQAAADASERDRVARREQKRQANIEKLRREREQQQLERDREYASPDTPTGSGETSPSPAPGDSAARPRVRGRGN
jgi:2',3'-cyclic-nucleotide 2'-phosphodiesterase (5'-nucleotidase family)